MCSIIFKLLNLAFTGRPLRVLALLCALCWFPALATAQTPSSDLVEELRLPLDKITPDLLPDRVPVPLKDYQALKTLAETTRDTPSTTRLIKAGYTATYSGGRLVAGRLAWTFENTSGLARTCPVEPLGFPVRDLKWGDQPAVWGTSPAGRMEVLLDRPTGEIQGRWELNGRTVGQHDEFLLPLPKATVSQLILNVPTGSLVLAKGQAVSAGPDQNGVTVWTIVLSGNAECRVVIHQPQPAANAAPLILVEHESLYALRQEGLRFRTNLRLEVTNASVSEIPIWADPELEIYSITYGNDLPLPWKTLAVDGRQRLLVQLPDALRGVGRVLRLRGVAPLKTDVEWKLPNVAVAGGALVEGTAVLQLTPPLQLQDVTTSGFRQTGIETSPTRDDLLTFKQFRSDGVLTVKLGKPRPRIMARVLSDLQTKSAEWTCSTQLQLTGAEGAAFLVECRIPTGWDVIDVRDPSNAKLDWTIAATAEGQRLLRLEFLEALTPDKTRTIEIDARRGAATGEQSHVVPAFEPLHVDDLGLLVAVNSSADVKAVPDPGNSFEPCQPPELDPEWLNSKFWKTPLTERTPQPLLLRLNGNAAEGRFSLQSKQTPVEVSADMRIDVSADKLTKRVKLKITPRHGKIERVLVYHSEPGPQLAWTLAGTPPRPVDARRLPPIRHAPWDLPPSGELWELRLPEAQVAPFELEGVRVRGLAPTGRLGLIVVPQAQAFEGRVTVNMAADMGLELTAWHTDSDVAASAGTAPLERAWTWHKADAALQYQTRVTPDQAPAPLIRRAALQVRWALEPTGRDDHLARFELGSGFTGREFRCWLPAAAELTEVRVDGQTLPVAQPTHGTPLVLTNVTDEQSVTMSYRTPAQGLRQPRWRGIALPKLEIPVLRCDLELLTPTGYRLGDEPRGMVLKSDVSQISILQRLFGPLGRAGRDAVFNPFTSQSWTRLWDDTSSVSIYAHDAEQAAALFAPPSTDPAVDQPVGWQVWRGSAAMLPEKIEVCLWSDRLAVGSGWLGFWTCLLLGTTLRLARVPHRGGLGMLALISESFLTLTLPPLTAQLAGGCLAGTLLSFMWPRRMIRRPAETESGQSPPVPQGSTRSYIPSSQSAMLVVMLAVSGLFGGLAMAQPLPVAGGLSRVIIPVDAQNQPLGQPPLAYLPERLLKDWTALQTAQQPRAAWLLTAGEYLLVRDAAQQVTATAKFDVTVLAEGGEVEVAIPLTGINLGGEQACLVDGQAHPVLTRSDAKTLLIRLPAVAPPPPAAPVAEGAAQPAAPAHSTTFNAVTQTHRIEFRGYPIIHAVADRQWMEFTLPRLNAASWTMRNEHPGSPWTIQTGEVSQTVAPGQSWVRELGPVTRLRIEPAAATPTLKPVVEARLALLADVQPAVSQLQYQVAYRVLQGQVSNVAWQLPAGLAVREVTGPEVFDWHIIPAVGGVAVLQVDLQSPVSEGFTIRVKGWMSNDGPPTQVTIPPVLLLTPNREPLRPVVALVGVRTPAEFLPEAPADLGEQIASATVDAFTNEWGTAGLAQPPQVAFSVFDPAPLKVGLRPLAAQRVVRLTSIGVLGSRRLQWTVNATIEVQTAAAYSHQIDVDPRMTVTSVTIQEDAANRLLRWTRTGNVLHVFLRDKTTGTQSLTLQGTMPAQVPQEMALPTVKFLDATVADARLQLYQEPDLEVEVSDPGKWEQLEVPSEVRLGAARNLLVGRFKWDPAAGPFIISAKQNEPLLTYSAVTSLQPRDGRWKLRTNLLFEVQRGHGSQFSIRVPPELPVVAVDAADVRQLFDAEPGGGQRIVLIPQAPVRGRFVVQVSGDLNLPLGGTGIIPEIVGLNATRHDHFVVLPVDGPLAVDPRNSGLTPTPLPSELAKLLPTELQGMKQAEYLGTPGTWAVTVSRPQEVVPQSGVLWSETQIWCGPPRQLSGRTTILLGPRDDEQIKLTIPAGIELRGVLLDGEFRPQASTVEQQLLIPLAYPQSGHVIILYWTRTTASFEGLFNRAEFQWPHVTGVRVMEQYATVTPPTGFRLHARQGRQAERINVQLGELQSLLRLMEQRFAGGAAVQDPQWMYLQRHVAGLVRRLDAETRLLGGTDETGARFAKLREQFRPWDLTPNSVESSVTASGISPATLRSFASLEGNLAGPHSILVQCGSEAGQSSLNVSIIRESLWSWGLGLSLALGIALAAWPLYRWKFPEWLAEQPSVAWLLLGLLWWLCLTPSWLGVVWLSLSGIYASRQIWRSYLPPLSTPGDDRSELVRHL